MQVLLNALTQLSEYKQLLEAMDAGQCPAAVSGLSAVHRAHFAAAIRRDTQRTVVLVCADEGEGDRLARDLSALTGEPVSVLTARAFTFHTGATVSRQWEHRRLGLLRALHEGQLGVLVATVEGLLQRTMSPQVLARASFTLRVGGTYDLNELAEQLARSG